MKYYPGLVEAAIEFKVESRKLICAKANKEYRKKAEHEFCPVPSSHVLRRDEDTGEILCCRTDQSISERRYERIQIPQK